MAHRRFLLLTLLACVLVLAPGGQARLLAVGVSPGVAPNGTTGVAYAQAFSGTGGTGPYTFAVTAGSLPPGLSLSGAGNLTGTPTSAGAYAFTITATDSLAASGGQAYSVSISPAPVAISPVTLPNALVAASYTQTLTPSGGTAPYTFALTGGALPGGMSVSAGGVLSGTPASVGSYNFTVTATDANAAAASRSYTLNVNPPTLNVSPVSLTSDYAGAFRTDQIQGVGGQGPYTYQFLSGSLPPGMSLTSAGLLSGTPTAGGTWTFTVQVTDANNLTASRTYALTVLLSTPAVNPGSLASGTYATAYNAAVSASGGSAPYTYAVSNGALPTGLVLTADGHVAGTPMQSGVFTFTIRATDVYGGQGGTSYTLVVTPPAIVVTTGTVFAATSGLYYRTLLSASGGVAPYSYSVTSGSLPSGLTLGADGTLSGIPSGKPGTFSVGVKATDANGASGVTSLTLELATPIILVTSTALANARVGAPYSRTITVAGGSAPYTFAVDDGALPAGLTLSPDGVLSGAPTSAGVALFRVRVTDAQGVSGQQSFRLVVDKAPVVKKSKPATKKKAAVKKTAKKSSTRR
jgi:hypothetical protein